MSRVGRVEEMPWTGPMHFDLMSAGGWTAGTAEMTVSLDTVTLRFGGRTLAVMVRDFFQAWLSSPAEPYAIDDVVWFGQADHIFLSVDDQLLYFVPPHVVDVIRVRL